MVTVPAHDERLARGRRLPSLTHPKGEPGTGWKTATEAQKYAWLDRIATICFTRHCSSFKSRPSSDCPRCGDSPVPLGISPYEIDRERGFYR